MIAPKYATGYNMTLLQLFGIGPKWTIVCGNCGTAFTKRLPMVTCPGVACPRCDEVNVIPVEVV